jgi:branched-chain amino acid transport system substrate-binding protein
MRSSPGNIFLSAVLVLLTSCASPGEYVKPASVSTTPPQQAAPFAPPPTPPTQQAVASRIPASATPVKVALLLPLSGESQALGSALMDAAMLALYDQYYPLDPASIRANVILMPKDTGVSPAVAAQAAEQAVQQGASLIIGPLYGNAVSEAAPVARAANVPMIALSNNKAVAGEGVFVFGFIPEQQVSRLADYIALKNITSVGALLPNDAYGAALTGALKSTLSTRGIRLEPVEQYARLDTNLDAAVARLKESYDKQPFEALFIGEGGDQLTKILPKLKAVGIDRTKVRLLGTGLWDDPDVMKNPDMQGAWFASGPASYQQQFERRFVSTYGYKPQRLASLAYDAVSLVTSTALSGGSAGFTPGALANDGGYIGPGNGLYRLKSDGTSERGLAVMEVNAAGFKILDAAPKHF